MLRLFFMGLAILPLIASSHAFADTLRDNEHKFKVTVPSGWKVDQNPSADIQVLMTSPRSDQTGASCNVAIEAHPKTSSMTQAQVDQALANEITDDAWAALFKSVIFFDDVTIEKTGTQMINGHKAYYVIARFNSVTPGEPIIPVRLKQYLHAIPGAAYWVTCSALQSEYASEDPAFESMFESFTITTDRIAQAQERGVPSLTLYAQENFGGVSHVVTQDTPDLALSGWREKAGSISVAGGDIWQVCDGANYSGRCRAVSSALRHGGGAQSARRLRPEEQTFAVMMQAVGAESAAAALAAQR